MSTKILFKEQQLKIIIHAVHLEEDTSLLMIQKDVKKKNPKLEKDFVLIWQQLDGQTKMEKLLIDALDR